MTKKYEDMVLELKEIVQKIESGDASLDETISLYEKGFELVNQCEKALEEAELKVSELFQER
ncbi:MAG: exodeoxyribonuclease VII small subunit [Methanogenium sp.]|nr:exodeoxyribonuclease VII small subunit [Methanogenium sp.]